MDVGHTMHKKKVNEVNHLLIQDCFLYAWLQTSSNRNIPQSMLMPQPRNPCGEHSSGDSKTFEIFQHSRKTSTTFILNWQKRKIRKALQLWPSTLTRFLALVLTSCRPNFVLPSVTFSIIFKGKRAWKKRAHHHEPCPQCLYVPSSKPHVPTELQYLYVKIPTTCVKKQFVWL